MSKQYEVIIDVTILETYYVTAPNKQEAYDRAVHESSEVAKGGIAKLFEVNIVREK